MNNYFNKPVGNFSCVSLDVRGVYTLLLYEFKTEFHTTAWLGHTRIPDVLDIWNPGYLMNAPPRTNLQLGIYNNIAIA